MAGKTFLDLQEPSIVAYFKFSGVLFVFVDRSCMKCPVFKISKVFLSCRYSRIDVNMEIHRSFKIPLKARRPSEGESFDRQY